LDEGAQWPKGEGLDFVIQVVNFKLSPVRAGDPFLYDNKRGAIKEANPMGKKERRDSFPCSSYQEVS